MTIVPHHKDITSVHYIVRFVKWNLYEGKRKGECHFFRPPVFGVCWKTEEALTEAQKHQAVIRYLLLKP